MDQRLHHLGGNSLGENRKLRQRLHFARISGNFTVEPVNFTVSGLYRGDLA